MLASVGDYNSKLVKEYWGRTGIKSDIFRILEEAGIYDLTVEKLAPLDQFHGGGLDATRRLAMLAEIRPGVRVLDIGGGFGGPARTLATEFGCSVVSLDLSDSYIQAASALTDALQLSDRVQHLVGDALSLPFDSESFDLVWTQNSGMNIEDKNTLYSEMFRVIRTGGKLVFQEPMAGPVQPILYPVMWAKDPSMSYLRTQDEIKNIITSIGFNINHWKDVTFDQNRTSPDGHTIQSIVMGDQLKEITEMGKRNRDENRILLIHAVLSK